ncbi:MAG: hypothetical protein WBA93_36415 [Microcoleaceae cyanobacterium]
MSQPPETEIEKLKRQVEQLERENSELKRKLNEARDPNPVIRPSRKRIHRLLMDAGMSLYRSGNWWLVKFGNLRQHYRKLTQIWKVIINDSWNLTDLFPFPSKSDTPPEETTKKRKPANPPRKPQRNLSIFQLELKQKLEVAGREAVRARGEPTPQFMDAML